MHRNVPYEFAITFSCKDVVDPFLLRALKVFYTPPVVCAEERVHKNWVMIVSEGQ